MTATLYEVLDVPVDADDAAIKAAHRRKVKDTHPDKHGGDRTAFEAVQKAYDVLKDPVRRAMYDETGETELNDPEAKKDRDAAKFAAELIELAIDTMEDVEGVDVIAQCRDRIRQKQVEIHGHIDSHESADARARQLLKRLQLKEGAEDSVIVTSIHRKRERLAKEMGSMQTALDIMDRVEAIYSSFTYRFDPPKQPSFSRGADRAPDLKDISPADFDRLFGHILKGSRP